MRWKTKKNVFLFFILLAGIAAVIIYKAWNKPHQDIRDADAVKTTASELYINLDHNSSNSLIFINKVVLVSGKVSHVLKNEQNQQVILLKTNTPGSFINCTMEEPANTIKEGDSISLKGICSGYSGGELGLPGDVFLIRCYRV